MAGEKKIHPTTFHDGNGDVVELQPYIFCNLSARWRLIVNATPRSLYSQERDLVWTGVENLTPHLGIKSALKYVSVISFPSVLIYRSQQSHDHSI